jgi:hypothetical protein
MVKSLMHAPLVVYLLAGKGACSGDTDGVEAVNRYM